MNTQDILQNLGISFDLELDNSETYDYALAGFDNDYDKRVIDFNNALNLNVSILKDLSNDQLDRTFITVCEIDNTPNDPNYIFRNLSETFTYSDFVNHFNITDHDYENFILNNDVYTYTGITSEVHYLKICSIDPPAPTSTPNPTDLPTSTPNPTDLPTSTPNPTTTEQPTPQPTSTEVPPTPTPTSTETPIPTITETPTPTPTLDSNLQLNVVFCGYDVNGGTQFNFKDDVDGTNACIVHTSYSQGITNGYCGSTGPVYSSTGTVQVVGSELTTLGYSYNWYTGLQPYTGYAIIYPIIGGVEDKQNGQVVHMTNSIVDEVVTCVTPTPTETPIPTSTETPLPTNTETPTPTPTEVSIDPSNINLQIWYDGADIGQFQPTNPSDGSTITQWNDKSAIAHNANPIGGSTSVRPSYETNELCGKSGVYFDGTDGLSINPITELQSLTGMTIIMVYRMDVSQQTGQTLYTSETSTGSYNSIYLYKTAYGHLNFSFTPGGILRQSQGPVFTDNNAHIITLTFNGNTTYHNLREKLWIDGVSVPILANTTLGSTTASNLSKLYVGAHPLENTGMNGYVFEMLVFDKELSSSERLSVENQLNDKWFNNCVTSTPLPTGTNTPTPTPTSVPTIPFYQFTNTSTAANDGDVAVQSNAASWSHSSLSWGNIVRWKFNRYSVLGPGPEGTYSRTPYNAGTTDNWFVFTGMGAGSRIYLTGLNYDPSGPSGGILDATGKSIVIELTTSPSYDVASGVMVVENFTIVSSSGSGFNESEVYQVNLYSVPPPTPTPSSTPSPTSTNTPTPTPQVWLPNNSITPVAWIDPSDTSSWSRFGSILASVTDKAGTYTMTVGGSPTTSSTQNGLNVFDFSGSGDFLQSTTYEAQVSSGNHFALGVFRYESTNNDKNSLWSYETNSSPKRDYAISSGASNSTWPGELDMDGLSTGRISSTIGNLQTWNLKSLTQNQYHIVSCWFNKTGNQIGVRVDGQNAFTPVNDYDNSIQTNQELRLMRNRASVELDGKMGEFIAYASMPGTSGTDMSHLEKAEGYLAHKWGLTGSLPSSHPYKNVAPTL